MIGPLFDAAEALDDDDQDLLPNLGIAALHIGDDAASYRFHGRLLSRARDTGAMVMVLYSLTRLALTDLATGAWASAEARCAEAVVLGEETGQPALTAIPKAVGLLIAARRADDSYDRPLADVEALTASRSAGILDCIVRDLTRWAKGVHTLSTGGKPAAAFHHLGQISHDIWKRMAGIDRVEVALASGQVAAARLWADDLRVFAEGTGQPWAHAVAAHTAALVSGALDDGAEAMEAHFLAAVQAQPLTGGRLFDRARTQLAYGEWLRRNRRRVDAREQLRLR